jgi:hypothetical protein
MPTNEHPAKKEPARAKRFLWTDGDVVITRSRTTGPDHGARRGRFVSRPGDSVFVKPGEDPARPDSQPRGPRCRVVTNHRERGSHR